MPTIGMAAVHKPKFYAVNRLAQHIAGEAFALSYWFLQTLQALNTSQPQQDKYIFIYHRLIVVYFIFSLTSKFRTGFVFSY